MARNDKVRLENKNRTLYFCFMSASAAAHLLTRTSYRRPDGPEVPFLEGLGLRYGRVHEICGSARRTLAVRVAGQCKGTVLWIRPGWETGRLNPEGMLPFADPSRFLFATPKRGEDLLWTAEEALRSGVVPLVVADIPGPPGLTAVRRLHLAAETGASVGNITPLGLLLTPGKGGAPGVESRWSLRGKHDADGIGTWRLARLRARTAPEAVWQVRDEGRGMALVQTREDDA